MKIYNLVIENPYNGDIDVDEYFVNLSRAIKDGKQCIMEYFDGKDMDISVKKQYEQYKDIYQFVIYPHQKTRSYIYVIDTVD